MFLAGVSSIDITPPVGCYLQGHDARNKPSECVHDPIRLKALAISDGRARAVIITSDVLYFSRELIDQLRREVKTKLKLRPECLFVTAAHVHTGPFLVTSHPPEPKIVPEYVNGLSLKIAGCIAEAIHNEEKVLLRWGTGSADIGVINRRLKTDKGVMMMPNPARPVDKQVSVLGIVRPDGSPKAILANYACHPTTLGTNIFQISADYPGVFQRVVERLYPGAIACFSYGCAGDVRPAIIAGHNFKGGSFADCERMGRILAGETMKVFEQARPLKSGQISGVLKTIRLPLDKSCLPSSRENIARGAVLHARRIASSLNAPGVKRWKKYWLAALKKHSPIQTFVPCEVQALKIGELGMIGIAAEVMVEIGLQIKARFPDRPLLVCSCVNAPIGYLPTAEAVREGGYETATFLWRKFAAPYAPEMEEMLISASANALRQARPGKIRYS